MYRTILLFLLSLIFTLSSILPSTAAPVVYFGSTGLSAFNLNGTIPAVTSADRCLTDPICSKALAGEAATAAASTSSNFTPALVVAGAAGLAAVTIWGFGPDGKENIRKAVNNRKCIAKVSKYCATGTWTARVYWHLLPTPTVINNIYNPIGYRIGVNGKGGRCCQQYSLDVLSNPSGDATTIQSTETVKGVGSWNGISALLYAANFDSTNPTIVANTASAVTQVWQGTRIEFTRNSDQKKVTVRYNTKGTFNPGQNLSTNIASGEFWEDAAGSTYKPSAAEIDDTLSPQEIAEHSTTQDYEPSTIPPELPSLIQGIILIGAITTVTSPAPVDLIGSPKVDRRRYSPGEPVLDPNGPNPEPSPNPSPSGSPSPSPSPSPSSSPSPSPSGSPSPSPSPSPSDQDFTFNEPSYDNLEPEPINSRPWPQYALEVFSEKFPFDLFGNPYTLGDASCPVYNFYGETTELCWLSTAVLSLKVPIIIGFVISAFWRL